MSLHDSNKWKNSLFQYFLALLSPKRGCLSLISLYTSGRGRLNVTCSLQSTELGVGAGSLEGGIQGVGRLPHP